MVLRQGRITKNKLKKVANFTSSIQEDYKLARYDIMQSIAHAKALRKAGFISHGDLKKLLSGLKKVQGIKQNPSNAEKKDYEHGKFEDIHLAIEESLGEIGKKLHAGRSRNDQIATDMRMYIREKILLLIEGLGKVIKTLRKKSTKGILMPSYTHLQRAQAVDLTTYLGVYMEWFKRDIQRFKELYKRVNLLPLGAAAGASSGIKLDLKMIEKELGFDGVIKNPMDAVSSRDYLMEFANNAAILGIHFSRMAEDLIIFSSSEFSFIEIDESIADTSSIMPQKKNPDCLELVRSASGKLVGAAMNLMVVFKGLPLTYNRDMQDDRAVFISAETALDIVDLMPDILNNLTFNVDKMFTAATKGFLDAADFAEYLVIKGVDFRVAHQKVGKLVRKGLKRGYSSFKDYSLGELKKEISEVQSDVFKFIDVRNSVSRRLYEK